MGLPQDSGEMVELGTSCITQIDFCRPAATLVWRFQTHRP